ncbi:MAG: AMP-binding protein [Rhodothalassiaceae bacterium]
MNRHSESEAQGAIPENPPGEEILHADRERLAALQLARLRWTLVHAYENVPAHRAAFDAAGVRPDDLRTLADLAHFPFMTKATFRDHYPFGLFAVPRERIIRLHASSGTTGRPTVVGYTRGDIDVWADAMARSIRTAGGRPGDIVHNAYGYGLFTGGLGAHYGAERLGCTVVPVSGGQTVRQVRLIRDFAPRVIMATPSYLLAIADAFRDEGLDPRDSALEIAILGAEPWSEEMRREIEDCFGIDAVDIYGLSELMGPGVAQECVETKDALHIWEDLFYPEIIDPESGAVRAEGEEGELVLTTLAREALPVVRYRTGDITRLMPGTVFLVRRMARIRGRSDDMMIIRGVNVFPSQFEEIVCAEPALAPNFLLERRRAGRLEALTLVVETRSGTGGDVDALTARLDRRIRSTIGLHVAVRVEPAGTLPRSDGKARRVVDLRASS